MKKLEDIPKQDFYRIPTGYFDYLPQKILNKLERPVPHPYSGAIRWSFLALLILSGILFFIPNKEKSLSAEKMLEKIETVYLVEYLAQSDLGLDAMIQETNLTDQDLENFESTWFEESYPTSVPHDSLEN